MLLVDELAFVASALRDGDAGPHTQITASRRLQRIAEQVGRLQQQMDGIVGDAQDEAALAAVPLERKPRFRLVVGP